MSEIVIVSLVSLAGTLAGSFGGIVTAARLTNFRLQQLERKVDKHNNFAERIPVLESRVGTMEDHLSKIDDALLNHKED